MVAFDTNVIIRVLVGDDPLQTRKAERAFVLHARGEGVFVSLVVLAEVAWVLGSGYGWDRTMIHARLSRLVRTTGVVIEELDLVLKALEEFQSGRADLADYFILGKARRAAGTLLTFDRKLAREPGAALL